MRVRLVSSIRPALLAAWYAVVSVDQGGAAAPGATVTVTNVATNRQVALKLVF